MQMRSSNSPIWWYGSENYQVFHPVHFWLCSWRKRLFEHIHSVSHSLIKHEWVIRLFCRRCTVCRSSSDCYKPKNIWIDMHNWFNSLQTCLCQLLHPITYLWYPLKQSNWKYHCLWVIWCHIKYDNLFSFETANILFQKDSSTKHCVHMSWGFCLLIVRNLLRIGRVYDEQKNIKYMFHGINDHEWCVLLNRSVSRARAPVFWVLSIYHLLFEFNYHSS